MKKLVKRPVEMQRWPAASIWMNGDTFLVWSDGAVWPNEGRMTGGAIDFCRPWVMMERLLPAFLA